VKDKEEPKKTEETISEASEKPSSDASKGKEQEKKAPSA